MRLAFISLFLFLVGFVFSSITLRKKATLEVSQSDTLFQTLTPFYNSEKPLINWNIENPATFEIVIDKIAEIKDSAEPSSLFTMSTYQRKTIASNSGLSFYFHSSHIQEHSLGKHEDLWKVSFKNSARLVYLKLTYEVLNNKSLLRVTSPPPPIVKQGVIMNYTAEIENPTHHAIKIKGLKMTPYEQSIVSCENEFPITIRAGGKTELKLKYETEYLPNQYNLSISFETDEDCARNWVTVPLNSEIIFVHGARILFDSLIQRRDIAYAGDGNFDFWYTNTGNEPLIISTAKTSCGCMVASWSREPLNPGERGVVHVKYDTKREGSSNKSVTVTSNAIPSISLLRIQVRVAARPVASKE